MRTLRYISRDPEIQSGVPCIAGTRWPTQTVIGHDYDRWAIAEGYPWLRMDQIDAAIRYERSWHRRLRRRAWQARFWLAAKMLGTDAATLREMW